MTPDAEDTIRETAYASGWPVWQPGQHFYMLAQNGEMLQGEVVSLDLDAGMVTCTTWLEDDFLGYVNAGGHRSAIQTVPVERIAAGEAEHERRNAARNAENREKQRIAKGGEQVALFDEPVPDLQPVPFDLPTQTYTLTPPDETLPTPGKLF